MLRIMLGTWALAGVLTGGLLTAVAQNPPATPESVNPESVNDEQPDRARQPSGAANQTRRDSAAQERAGRHVTSLQDERPPEAAALERGGVTEDPNDLGIQFRTSNTGGLMISSLHRQGAAFQSGLREGDQIVSVGGRTFVFEPALREFLLQQSERQQIPVVVMRDGQRETITWSLQSPQMAERQGAVPRVVRRPVYGRSSDGSEQALAGIPRQARMPQRHEAARPDFELAERVQRLESEVTALRSQLQALQRMNSTPGSQAGQGNARVPAAAGRY